MGRLATSWSLTKQSAKVLSHDKELLWMPVLSFLASVVAMLLIAGIGFASGVLPEVQTAEGDIQPVAFVLTFALYIALAFVSIFFGAATVAGASERLAGGDPTVGSALRKASSHVGAIFLWAIVVATVNVILQMLRERSGALGRIMASFAGLAWNLATYFVIPIILFDHQGLGSTVKKSGALFKQRWGESAMGLVGVGMAGSLVGFLVLLVGGALVYALATLGTAALIAGVVVVGLAFAFTVVYFAALQGVYKAALYRYATTGQDPPGFDGRTLHG